MSNKIDISVVIPVYNEEKNVDRYEKELLPVLDSMNKVYEVIIVEDGSSKDNSWQAVKNLAKKFKPVIALKHSRNYGMGAAYQTAFNEAKGSLVITFSADLEISPKYIKNVADKLDEGFDVVNTNRVGRWSESGGLLRTLPSNIANKLIRYLSGVCVEDTGSGLKGFRKYIVDNLKIYGDMHRFIPAYSSMYTNRITEIDVDYNERTYGKSAYGSLSRTFNVFLDLISMKFMLSFSTKPFSMMPGRIFGSIGLGTFLFGTLISFYMILTKIIYGSSIGNRPLFIVGLILIVLGVQLLMMGLLGELLMRIYFEGSNKNPYIVIEKE